MTRILLLLAASTFCFGQDGALRIHPRNPKYFEFRGKPLVLLAATEHYGSVMNRPFDFEAYLRDAADKRITLTRTFLLFRELQSARNPYSTCKPESPDYIAPWPRTGPGNAMDGEPVYDLDGWNPEYFDRLRRFLRSAADKGIIVELVVFSNAYADNIWALNPLRARNNRQGVGNVEWPEYLSLKDTALVQRQKAYARKIIAETSGFDNIYYEICNEPGGSVQGHVSAAEVDDWQEEMARTMRDELTRLGRSRLIAGQEAFRYTPRHTFTQDKGLGSWILQIVNVHPLPNTVYRDREYNLGGFMSKELKLAEMIAFNEAVANVAKPVVHDEDNTASMYRDATGWTIHRKRAWASLMTGAHYDYIDFSIVVGRPSGTAESNAQIRSWMRHLSSFIHDFDFIGAKVDRNWIGGLTAPLVTAALDSGGADFAAYIADAREWNEAGAGEPVEATARLTLPIGRYRVTLYSPVTGLESPAIEIAGGSPPVDLPLPAFRHDIVVRARRVP